MRLRTAIPLAFVGFFAIGCSDATAPAATPLVGEWTTGRMPLGPGASYESRLGFARDGHYVGEVRNYSGAQLTSSIRLEGTYRVSGDQLSLWIARQVTWDSFYGADSPPQVRTFDLAAVEPMRFTLSQNELTLQYTTYPADGPVETTATYQRASCTLRLPSNPLRTVCD